MLNDLDYIIFRKLILIYVGLAGLVIGMPWTWM